MDNDVAVFLDLDNVLIGAAEAKLTFDINLILNHIRTITNGRVVLRQAYGDWRQRGDMTKDLASAGFELQSTVRLGNMSKNLADMQMVVDAMSTLVDGQNFATYVVITGDRDFVPLVQALRKRGKQVIGLGVRHTTSQSLMRLCDEYIFYDQMINQAQQLVEEQVEELLERALDQLLQGVEHVPASLLKQRLQTLSKGAFARSPQGKGSFRKFLKEYDSIVALRQEDTTLYVGRPGTAAPEENTVAQHALPDAEVKALLARALKDVLADTDRVRASLLKQRMQDLSQGVFDESEQGDKSFRRFLERHTNLLQIDQEGSTLYVRAADSGAEEAPVIPRQELPLDKVEELLGQALGDLLVDQSKVRASLLKQRLQELSDGQFDEADHGFGSFRQFLESYPQLVSVQQKGSTLLAHRPHEELEIEDLHLHYRSALKKRGLRVIPHAVRIRLLGELVKALREAPETQWRLLIRQISSLYLAEEGEPVSKSYVNDVLRVARRAAVIGVRNGNKLATAPVYLRLTGEKLFQDAVIRCDAVYLREIQALNIPFDLQEASVALYESLNRVHYLKVILHRFVENGQVGTPTGQNN